MIRMAMAALLLAAALTGPAAAAEKKVMPKLAEEAKDGAGLARENIVKMKIGTVRPVQPNPPAPPVGGPALPTPQSPGS